MYIQCLESIHKRFVVSVTATDDYPTAVFLVCVFPTIPDISAHKIPEIRIIKQRLQLVHLAVMTISIVNGTVPYW